MSIQICLLVSDDPDEHQAISEALSAVSQDTILLNIIDSQRAILLLQSTEYQPDRLILDLSMHGIKVNSLLKVVRSSNKKVRLPVILYGTPETFSRFEKSDDVLFFNKEVEFSQLRNLLGNVLFGLRTEGFSEEGP